MTNVKIEREYAVDPDGKDELLFRIDIPVADAPRSSMTFQVEYLDLTKRKKKAPNNPQTDFVVVGTGEKGKPKPIWFASGFQTHFAGKMKARFEWADSTGNDRFAEAVFDAGNQVNSSQNVAIKNVPSVELTFYARYDDPWASEQSEVLAMREQRWEPSNANFAAACRVHSAVPCRCEDFDTFAGEIIKQAVGSIGRINLLTHSIPGLISLAGRIDATPTSIDVFLGCRDPQGPAD